MLVSNDYSFKNGDIVKVISVSGRTDSNAIVVDDVPNISGMIKIKFVFDNATRYYKPHSLKLVERIQPYTNTQTLKHPTYTTGDLITTTEGYVGSVVRVYSDKSLIIKVHKLLGFVYLRISADNVVKVDKCLYCAISEQGVLLAHSMSHDEIFDHLHEMWWVDSYTIQEMK